MIKTYFWLAKPGIVSGNALTCAAGFFFASQGYIEWSLLAAVVVGVSLIVGSACAFNNYFDRDIDAKMERAKDRPLPKGDVSESQALFFASVLGVLGILVLALFTNLFALGVAFLGICIYIGIYTPLKRHTPFATEVGSFAGATPPVAGYVAAIGTLDVGALLLFVIFALWQLPHFFAIAIRRIDEYSAANIPVRPITDGLRRTKVRMALYVVAFTIAALGPVALKLIGYPYLVAVTALGFSWLMLSISGFWTHDDKRWARHMFFYSLVVLSILCVMIFIG